MLRWLKTAELNPKFKTRKRSKRFDFYIGSFQICKQMNTTKNKRNKRLLFILALLFTGFVLYLTIDFMGQTTRPGAKKHLPNSILK